MAIDNFPPPTPRARPRLNPDITHLDSSPQSWNMLYSRANMPLCEPAQSPHDDWLFVSSPCMFALATAVDESDYFHQHNLNSNSNSTTATTTTITATAPSIETSSENNTTHAPAHELTSSNIHLHNLIHSPEPAPDPEHLRGRAPHRRSSRVRSSARSRPPHHRQQRHTAQQDQQDQQHMDPWAPAGTAATYDLELLAVGSWADEQALSPPAVHWSRRGW